MQKVMGVHKTSGAVVYGWRDDRGAICASTMRDDYCALVGAVEAADNWEVTPVEFFPGEKVDILHRDGTPMPSGVVYWGEDKKSYYTSAMGYGKRTIFLRPHVEEYEVTVRLTEREVETRAKMAGRHLAAAPEYTACEKLDQACAAACRNALKEIDG